MRFVLTRLPQLPYAVAQQTRSRLKLREEKSGSLDKTSFAANLGEAARGLDVTCESSTATCSGSSCKRF
jgi:hypothetical protein